MLDRGSHTIEQSCGRCGEQEDDVQPPSLPDGAAGDREFAALLDDFLAQEPSAAHVQGHGGHSEPGAGRECGRLHERPVGHGGERGAADHGPRC